MSRAASSSRLSSCHLAAVTVWARSAPSASFSRSSAWKYLRRAARRGAQRPSASVVRAFSVSRKAGQPGTDREQHLADLVLGFEDLAAALAQTRMIQTEHAREKAAIGTGQEWRERAVTRGERNLLWREQSVLVALSAPHFERFFVVLQNGSDAHAGVVVEEIEWRVVGDAEEHVLDGRERGGLARLIGSEQDVDVRIVDRQPKRDLGESAIAEQIKPAKYAWPTALPL